MRIKYENNTVTIDTEIAASLLDGAKGGILKCKDDKGNDVYAVAKTERADALSELKEFFFPVNAVSTEGNAMLVAVVPMDVTVEDIKKDYGTALVAASKSLPVIAAEYAHFNETVDALFAE